MLFGILELIKKRVTPKAQNNLVILIDKFYFKVINKLNKKLCCKVISLDISDKSDNFQYLNATRGLLNFPLNYRVQLSKCIN